MQLKQNQKKKKKKGVFFQISRRVFSYTWEGPG